jgi:hypothetical protein
VRLLESSQLSPVEDFIEKVVNETLSMLGLRKKSHALPRTVENHESFQVDNQYYDESKYEPLTIDITSVKNTVRTYPRAAASWTAQHFQVRSLATVQSGGNQPQGTMLCGGNQRRRSIAVANNGTDYIVIGPTSEMTTGGNGSARLMQGQTIVLETLDAVWALANSGIQDVDVIQMFEDGPGVAN